MKSVDLRQTFVLANEFKEGDLPVGGTRDVQVRTDARQFLEALGRLRPADRQVIVWRIELGYTAEEIATKLGKSKAAAGMTVTRAMARLAKELKLDAALRD